ncbi:MAG: hypothetical protein D3908_16505 [Candidatus Electrothrix sp. AUS4]|nr:hypothetical protein [Candidatus Electrothrix sp. AUS4]
MKQRIIIHSLYWNNIHDDIVKYQNKIFSMMGVDIVQYCDHERNHGEWMDFIIKSADDNDIIFFADIDSFPTNIKFFDWVLSSVDLSTIVGVAQVANHLSEHDKIYAGPIFLAFYKRTWLELGMPTMVNTSQYDTAQILSDLAIKANVQLELTYPYSCIEPRWSLSDRGVFGIGTFYNYGYFHLFQARHNKNVELYNSVAQDVLKSRPLDFEKYLRCRQKPQVGWMRSLCKKICY